MFLGGVIYPTTFHKLLPQIGFGWTTRVIGFMILATMVIPNVCMRVRVLPAQRRSLFDLAALTEAPYTLNILGFFIGFVGLYMPFFYSQVYAIDTGLTNPDFAFYLVPIINSTSVFGRIIPNFLADILGPFNVVIPFTITTSILCFLFITPSTSAGLVVIIALYGFFSGTFVSLPPSIIVSLSTDKRDRIGARMGQTFAFVAVGLLIGTPIGGAIVDTSGYWALWVFGGCMLMGGAAVLVAARVSWKGWSIMVKA